MTTMRAERCAGERQVVGDEDRRHAHLLGEIVDQIHDHRLRGHVEAGGRLVGDQERRLCRQRDRDHDALAHAARHFERIGLGAARRVGDADRRAASRSRWSGASRRGTLPWRISTSAICRPTVRIGLSAVRGFWKIIAISRPRTSASWLGLGGEQIEPAEHGAPGGDFAGGIENAHHRIGGDRFARAGFADQRDGLALVDGKARHYRARARCRSGCGTRR